MSDVIRCYSLQFPWIIVNFDQTWYYLALNVFILSGNATVALFVVVFHRSYSWKRKVLIQILWFWVLIKVRIILFLNLFRKHSNVRTLCLNWSTVALITIVIFKKWTYVFGTLGSQIEGCTCRLINFQEIFHPTRCYLFKKISSLFVFLLHKWNFFRPPHCY